MSRRPKKPSAPPSDQGYAAWKRAALAELDRLSGSGITTMRETEWKRLFVARKSAEEAAQVATTYQHNVRMLGKTKRR